MLCTEKIACIPVLLGTLMILRLFLHRSLCSAVFNCTFYIADAIYFLQDILHVFFRKLHTVQERIRKWQAQHWELSIELPLGANRTAPDWGL